MTSLGEAERVDALRAGDLRILELIATGVPLADVLDALVRVIEDQAEGMLGSILLLEDGARVRHGAAPNLPLDYIAAIDGQPIGPANGSCGTAAFRRETVVVEDIATDPLWVNYRDAALQSNLRACWSVPIFGADQSVLGTFALYYSRPRRPTPELMELTSHATHMATIAIERERHAAALVESQRHLSLIYDHVADVVFQLQVEDGGVYRFVSVNRAFHRATGLTVAQVIGKRVDEVIPQPSLALVTEKYAEAVRTGRTVRWSETTKYPTGVRVGDVAVAPVFDELGRVKFLVGSVRDVTDARRLEEQMRHLQKMDALGQLSGGIAHDFNNILSAILGYATLLRHEVAAAPQHAFADEIVQAVNRASGLTRQILAFSRKQVMRPEVLELSAIVSNLQKMLQRLIGEDIALITELDDDGSRIVADPGQIEQVVVNLVVNARDALPLGGKVYIRTKRVDLDAEAARDLDLPPGPYAELSITDTGVGMDADVRQHIFEPFFTTKEAGKGTGLGLATVYGIVKQSGGSISVTSEPGAGATFAIYLPRTTDMVRRSVERPVRRSSGGIALTRILLVEDDSALRALFATVLDHLNCRGVAADSATHAVRMIEHDGARPDLVVTDIVMPDMSGTALAERLRRTVPDLKVLYISGYPDDAIARHGVDPNTPFLQKPFDIDQLAAAIEAALYPE